MNADKQSKLIKMLVVAGIALLVFLWLIKHFTKPKPPVVAAPTVVVQKPAWTKITDYVTQTGTMVAFNSVNLVARVEGYLNEIKFVDGSAVKKDQELFVIEPESYQDKLKEAQAALDAQKASYDYAVAEYARQQRMYKQNATSLNNVEKWSAKKDEYKAGIDNAMASLDSAQLTYSYTHVRAPFDGRIGRHLVDLGNLVGNGVATNLATIEQIDPIYVYFNLNELDLIKIRAAAKTQAFKPKKINEIPVGVKMQNETSFLHEGQLNFANTGLNASTGTLEFRALLPNKDFTLLPGLFVQIRIPISKPAPQLTIPDTAVQYDQIGAYILTVDKNNVVVEKRVETGAVEQGTRAITKGLEETDNVIVSGIQNATPGNQVTPVQAENKSP